jgi:hypothetical protein
MRAPRMERFVVHRNIRRYRNLLEIETDEARRRTIREMLAKEDGKLADLPGMQREMGSQRVLRSD